ncbi:MAG TPA: MOSC N-terminal beta barrel domain-containing protein [Chryseolinea sp.]|nr:MOSC N-terminal beta barrel domain-containing protein [Chryseolinea sp.]
MGELKLTQIWIYPIKSLGGIPLTEAKVMGKGLQHDRRWMLVDSDDVFLTQRDHPLMALFKLTIDEEKITITYKGDQAYLPLTQSINAVQRAVRIWDDVIMAYEVSDALTNWFTERMGMECHLMAFPEANPRQVDPDRVQPCEHVSLADAYPFMIIGQSSLDDLNKRLVEPVSIKRFRPNFVFTGGEAYEEDLWKDFTIGPNKFSGVKPCARCVLTTVDPETGSKGTEPLRTLATYRKRNNKIFFGQNVVARERAFIRVGDVIRLDSSHVLDDKSLVMGSGL